MLLASLISSTFKFIKAAVEDDRRNEQQVLTQQFSHIMAVIRKSRPTHEDATNALTLLRTQSVFSEDQARALRSSVLEVSALSLETSVVMSSTETQTHAHIEHYLSQRSWD